MQFKQHFSGRYVMFFVGLLWTAILPLAYALLWKQLLKEHIAFIVFLTICMALLFFAAIRLLLAGISGFCVNGKTHLILENDGLQIIINGGKFKGTVYRFHFSELNEFCFTSHGAKQEKASGNYYVKEGASGIIGFTVDKKYYCADVYNALPAAKYILERLQDSQINGKDNELDKNGTYHPQG